MNDILRAFPAILKALGADSSAVERLVFAAWSRNVDGAFAENVLPVRLDGKRLIAAVPNETWRRQVMDLGPAMVDKVNATLGNGFLTYVEFTVDPETVFERKKKPALEGRRKDAVLLHSPELSAAAAQISDESLRSLFLSAATGSLARNAEKSRSGI